MYMDISGKPPFFFSKNRMDIILSEHNSEYSPYSVWNSVATKFIRIPTFLIFVLHLLKISFKSLLGKGEREMSCGNETRSRLGGGSEAALRIVCFKGCNFQPVHNRTFLFFMMAGRSSFSD